MHVMVGIRVPKKTRWQIITLSDDPSQSISSIASITRVGRAAIRNIIERYNETGDIEEKVRSGRPRKTTVAQDKRLQRIVRRHDEEPSTVIADHLEQQCGLHLSAQSVRRRCKEMGLLSLPMTSKPALTEKQKVKRIAFARKHRARRWGNVLFSDETTIQLGSRKRVSRRRKGEKKFRRAVKYPGKVNVWGCFGSKGFGYIYVFRENLTGSLFSTILDECLLESAKRAVPKQWILQQDNDPKHTSLVARRWLDEHNIKRLDWPANSPDLNPIENVWALLKDRVANRRPGNLDELEQTIKQEWNALTRDYAFSLISSMPSRLKQVIERDGDAVDY
jgi:transposase